MYNSIVIVGRIKEIKSIDDYVYLKVTGKDKKGNEEIIDVKIDGMLANTVREDCDVGTIIGVKGEMFKENNDLKILGRKVTFLSTRKDLER